MIDRAVAAGAAAVGVLLALDAHERLGKDAEAALQFGRDASLTSLEPEVR